MTDLRSRLHDVVDVPADDEAVRDRGASAHDDVVVGALTTRVRRRRAVRTGAFSAAGALTVAAVVVGGAAVADRLEGTPAPPASEAPAPDGVATLGLDCGDRVPTEALHPVEGDLWLVEPEVVSGRAVEGEPLDVRIRLRNDGAVERAWDTQQVVRLAALRDGTVVATGSLPIGYFGGAGVRLTARDPVAMGSCEVDGSIPAGDYELVAAVALANADGSDLVGLSSGPVPFTVAPAPATADERRRQAEAALAEVIAAAESARADAAVGACGARMPEVTDPYLGLGLEVGSAATGEALYGDAALTARDGLTVVGEAPLAGVRVVLTVDGVVVGRGAYDGDYLTRLRVSAGEPLELPAIGDAVLCRLPGGDGPTLPLPAGTYQAYGLYQVAVTEVEQVDGGSVDVSTLVTGTRTVVSAPVDVAIDDQLG